MRSFAIHLHIVSILLGASVAGVRLAEAALLDLVAIVLVAALLVLVAAL